jgi:phage baseplate assembly protein W
MEKIVKTNFKNYLIEERKMSLSLILPLTISGMGLDSFPDEATRAAIQQNIRMLLLTAPGEYPMDINFGVGLRHYLFELARPELASIIKSEIIKQCKIYMPYISVNSVSVDLESSDENILGIIINYSTTDSILEEIFELSVSS